MIVIYFCKLLFHPNLKSFLKTQKFRYRIVNNMNYVITALVHTAIFSQPKETNINYKYRIMCQTASSSLKSLLLNTFQ